MVHSCSRCRRISSTTNSPNSCRNSRTPECDLKMANNRRILITASLERVIKAVWAKRGAGYYSGNAKNTPDSSSA